MKKAKRQLNGPRCQGRPQQPLPHGSAHGSPHELSHKAQLRQLALRHGRPHSAPPPSSQPQKSQPVVHRAQATARTGRRTGPHVGPQPSSHVLPHEPQSPFPQPPHGWQQKTAWNRPQPVLAVSKPPSRPANMIRFTIVSPQVEAKSGLSTGVIVRTTGRIEKIVRTEMVGAIVLYSLSSPCQLF